ncbi:hypothetical protein ACF08B_10895 [Streptomyces sp. NPDC015139]|uniref:hypothetical protein n=1 Tax=Streptomyces sp. NPDC015139 TaxID=3364942 RepID=UPI0036FEECD5
MSFWMHRAAVFGRSIHAVRQKACTPPEAAASAGAVRTRTATDGSTAVARGREWRTRAGDVEVAFRPRPT